MPLQLSTLQFRQKGDATTLPLLLNLGTTPLALPEWQAGDTNPLLSPVACKTGSGVGRTVLATFTRDDASIGSFDVMASAAAGNPNLLGEIAATTVNFPAGKNSVTVALPFSGSSLSKVAVHTDSFAWQTRVPAGVWTNLVTTSHRIYVVLDTPGSPWDPTTQANWVWSDVLEFACAWAGGVQTIQDARGAIAAAFFNLGKSPGQIFAYGGSNQYTTVSPPMFDCAHMLKSLSGVIDTGNVVQCSDVAATVSTFANALGGTVWQARMGLLFNTTPIELIGANTFASIEFGFHEVAWANEAAATDPVWDGCLQVSQGGLGVSALDLPFQGYRPELLSSGTCNPQNAGSPSNRPIGILPTGTTHTKHIKPAAVHHAAVRKVLERGTQTSGLFVWGFFPTDDLVKGWSIRSENPVQGAGPKLPAFDTYWRQVNENTGPLMRIQFASLPAGADAEDYLLRTLEDVATPVLSVPLGDYGFATGDGQFAVYVRGNVVFRFNSAGLNPVQVVQFAQQTDNLLTSTTAPVTAISPRSDDPDGPQVLPFPLPNTTPAGQPLWYRLLTSTGSISAVDGTLQYQPDQSGDQLITVCSHLSGQQFRVQNQPFLAQ